MSASGFLGLIRKVTDAELRVLELASTGRVQVAHIVHLRDIELQGLPTELREYVTDLLEG
ncbi:hypothetical protein ABZ835_35670 [Streptomyces sp. NPDC047461]|uniref:hypothetical protein n=1 Tax=Streptomyces sp. NPDC047461 TaxID=3155619 RepID=UPI0033CFBD15